MTIIYFFIALKIASVIVSGSFANALNVVVISGNTFKVSQTDFLPLPHKLETTSQPVKAYISLVELCIYLDRSDWQLSGQEYSGNFDQCQMPAEVVSAYIEILPLPLELIH